MEYVQDLLNTGEFPVLTAFLLGLLVALHPCPMAVNIAAMGYIAKDMDGSARVFRNGLLYTIGRTVVYSVLGAVLIAVIRRGIDILHVGESFSRWGEPVLVVILISVGVWMLLNPIFHKHEHVPSVSGIAKTLHGPYGSFALGIILALAFCPESAIVYFGMLIPMSAKSSVGYSLPLVFAIATALPTIVLAWVFAYGINGVQALRTRIDAIQKWMNPAVGIIFIAAGIFCMFF